MFILKYRSSILLSFLTLVMIALKIYFAKTGFLNFEGSFYELSRQLMLSFKPLSSALYFEYQANPIGTSLLINIFKPIAELMTNSSGVVARLPSILGLIPLVWVLLSLLRRQFPDLSDLQQCAVVFFILLHPSIWTFSGRAFSDSYYFLIAFSVYSFYLNSRNLKTISILACLLFVAAFFKVNTIVLLGTLGVHTLLELFRRFGFKQLKNYLLDFRILLFLATITGFICYYFVALYLEIPFRQNSDALLQTKPIEIFRNIILYNLHFLIVGAPITLFIIHRNIQRLSTRQIKIGLLATLVITLLYALFCKEYHLFNTGELNFGSFLDAILAKYMNYILLPGVFLSAGYLVSLFLVSASKTIDDFEFSLITLFISVIVLHSMVKPVQRYLLILIFFQVIHFLYLYKWQLIKFKKYFFTSFILLFLAVDLFLSFQNKVKSDAYLELGQQIETLQKYRLDIQSDDLRCHLFGNVEESFLVETNTRPPLCVYDRGFTTLADPNVGLNAVIWIQQRHPFSGKIFNLVAAPCAAKR